MCTYEGPIIFNEESTSSFRKQKQKDVSNGIKNPHSGGGFQVESKNFPNAFQKTIHSGSCIDAPETVY